MNLTQRQYADDKESPGSGGGIAGNPQPREMERQAVQKRAGDPGSKENALGMTGGPDSGEKNPHPDRGDTGATPDEPAD